MPIAGIGIALPGLVDTGAGPLRVAPNLHWYNVDVARALAAEVDFGAAPVILANEATLAAQAEAEALRHTDIHTFIYISGEIGIGGAIIRRGEIVAGSHGWSGEIGHTLVDPGGPECGCGALGCLEQYAGKDALLRAAGIELNEPVEVLLAAAAAGAPAALQALRTAGSALGLALSNAINLVDLDTVVLGGIYAPIADHLLPAIAEQLQRRVLWNAWAPVQVLPARVRDQAALTGAARTVLATVLADPSGWVARAQHSPDQDG